MLAGLRRALLDLAPAITLTVLASASAYTLLFAATLWRGGWLGGIAPGMWIYVAFAAAVAIGVGCALTLRVEREPFPFARGALVAFGVCGVAGVVGLVLLGEVPDPKAAAVRSLIAVAAVAVPLGAAAVWRVLRIPSRQALAGALGAAVAFRGHRDYRGRVRAGDSRKSAGHDPYDGSTCCVMVSRPSSLGW